MVFGLWQKLFGRKFWQGFLDCNRCRHGNVFRFCSNFCFITFGLLSDVLFDFWRNSHSGFVKTAFLWCEIFFEVINFETIKHVSKSTDSDPFCFITLTTVFLQHCVNCILNVHKKNWRDFVSLKTPGRFCQFRFFGNRSWALLQKKFRPYFQNSIRGDQSNNLRKNKFFKEISFFLEVSHIYRKLLRFLAKKTDRNGNLLWFLGVNGSILKKNGFFKSNMNKLCHLVMTWNWN